MCGSVFTPKSVRSRYAKYPKNRAEMDVYDTDQAARQHYSGKVSVMILFVSFIAIESPAEGFSNSRLATVKQS